MKYANLSIHIKRKTLFTCLCNKNQVAKEKMDSTLKGFDFIYVIGPSDSLTERRTWPLSLLKAYANFFLTVLLHS